MKRLLCCPFCGDDAELDFNRSCDISWSIDSVQAVCITCLASSDIIFCDNLDRDSCKKAVLEVIILWNTRKPNEITAPPRKKLEL
jgi:hypothetical protein